MTYLRRKQTIWVLVILILGTLFYFIWDQSNHLNNPKTVSDDFFQAIDDFDNSSLYSVTIKDYEKKTFEGTINDEYGNIINILKMADIKLVDIDVNGHAYSVLLEDGDIQVSFNMVEENIIYSDGLFYEIDTGSYESLDRSVRLHFMATKYNLD